MGENPPCLLPVGIRQSKSFLLLKWMQEHGADRADLQDGFVAPPQGCRPGHRFSYPPPPPPAQVSQHLPCPGASCLWRPQHHCAVAVPWDGTLSGQQVVTDSALSSPRRSCTRGQRRTVPVRPPAGPPSPRPPNPPSSWAVVCCPPALRRTRGEWSWG